MSKIEDFKNAPVGATATHEASGGRAMKVDDEGRPWVYTHGFCMDDEDLTQRGYTLDPLEPAPTTAREALDLAWDLAHEVREGRVIPDGARVLEFSNYGIKEYTVQFGFEITAEFAPVFRTVEPLPDPEPDWNDAPAVLARLDEWDRDKLDVFTPAREGEGGWTRAGISWAYHWSELRNVTPLYPKGQEA